MAATLRPAAPADAPLIHAHAVVSTPADGAAALSGDIAERDGRPAGFAPWSYGVSTFAGRHGIQLEDLDVRPEHRRRGLGRARLAAAGPRA